MQQGLFVVVVVVVVVVEYMGLAEEMKGSLSLHY